MLRRQRRAVHLVGEQNLAVQRIGQATDRSSTNSTIVGAASGLPVSDRLPWQLMPVATWLPELMRGTEPAAPFGQA